MDAIRLARANLNHESGFANHGVTIKRAAAIRVIRRLLVNLSRDENGLARICISKAVSLVGRRDARMRDLRHVDGHRVSERDEMDH